MLPGERFRHIVFPADVKQRPKIINFAHVQEKGATRAEPVCDLSQENALFLNWLFAQAGLDARLYRAETLQRRVPACLRALHVRSTAQARRLLEQKPSLAATALGAILVGVTWFFRDVAVFDLLRDYVIPTVAGTRRSVYAWSVGCSEGAELYSLALLLAEMDMLANSYLLGTDCRSEAIARAQNGWFDSEAIKDVPPPLLARYFTCQAQGYRVNACIRTALHWRTGDVLTATEPGVWDLVFCRNTTMYLRPEATARLWEQFEKLLRPGGVLVLGKAERPVGAKRLSLLAPCIYRRNRG